MQQVPQPPTENASLCRVATARMPTKWGLFSAAGFVRTVVSSGRIDTAMALMLGDLRGTAPLLRVHSQCLTGEGLDSLRCDCGEQLSVALQAIAAEGRGLVIYEYQEGRGIGLMAKLQAYELQDAGIDTVEANHVLGLHADYRDYLLPAAIVRELGIQRVRLLTNNPAKMQALMSAGIQVDRISCEAKPNSDSLPYLRTKQEKMGHFINLATTESSNQTPASPSAQTHRMRPRTAIDKILS